MKLYKAKIIVVQVLFVFFLIALVGTQGVLAQTTLPSCTADLIDTYTEPMDDGVAQEMDIDKNDNGLIEICDLEGLNEIRYQLDGTGYTTSTGAAKITDGCPSGVCRGYELTRSLDFETTSSYRVGNINTEWTMGDGWQAIGRFPSMSFRAIFDGNDYTISNLMINSTSTNFVGLFSFTQNSEINNLGLLNVNIKGGNRIGALVGTNRGSITNSHATGSVDGESRIGGLVGQSRGSITNSYAAVNVDGEGDNVGGLAGSSSSNIDNSYATGSVTGSGDNIGGLAGFHNVGDITDSYATGDVEGKSDNVGGLVGRNRGRITRGYATGSVTWSATNAGGLVGWNQARIFGSYAAGDVSGGLDNAGGLAGHNDSGFIRGSYATGDVDGRFHIGGLVGDNDGSISRSHATGDVGGRFYVGGLVGTNRRIISESYATGNIDGLLDSIGGLVGQNTRTVDNTSVGSITNSYATGNVSGRRFIGGLIGDNFRGSITNSYATGPTTGTSRIGGLAGLHRDHNTTRAEINHSYWLSGSASFGGVNVHPSAEKTAEEHKSPTKPGTTPTDIYYNWDDTVWDFGTSDQFPVIKTLNGNLLPNQGIGLRNLAILTENTELRPVFGVSTLHYVIFFVDTSSIDLDLTAYNNDAMIEIIKQGAEDTDYFSGKGSSGQSDPIPIDEDDVLVIMVAEAGNSTTSYTIRLEKIRVSDITVSEMTENGTIDTDNIAAEGSTVTLGALTNDDSGDYGYQWTQTGGRPLLPDTSTASPSFTIPADFVASDTMPSTDIVIRLTLMHRQFNSLPTSLSKTITINKINNGVPVIATTLTQSGFDLEVEARIIDADIDGDGTFSYQWQGRDFNADSWVPIPSATTAGYTVPVGAPGGRFYRVQLTYNDAQGYKIFEYLTADEIRRDVDTDDDGLIEIYYLEHLDAIRYDLGGTHYATMLGSDGINRGCREDVCDGYELARSLDFNDDASYISTSNKVSWTMGAGWQPIGDLDEPFDARFASTDTLVIRNLFINRPDEDYVGLFGVSNDQISGLNLQDVNINGRFIVGGIAGVSLEPSVISDSSVDGTVSGSDAWVGGLVGVHDGSIANSYAQGEVIGDTSVGGLAGYALGAITNSYAHSNISSQAYGGGLVGYHQGRQGISGISDSYAAGSVEGVFYLGGLVGYNEDGIIANAYAFGDVVGGTNVGGLVGYSDGGMITASAGDGNVAGANNVGGLAGSVNGGSITGNAMIPDRQDIAVGRLLALGGLSLSAGTLEPPFDPSVDEYEIFDISEMQTTATVTVTANKADATVAIVLGSQTMSMDNEASLTVQLADLMDDDIVVTLTASSLTALGQTTKTYTITLPAQPNLTSDPLAPCDVTNRDLDNDGLIDICDIEGLYAMRYPESLSMPVCGENSTGTCIGYELAHDLDFDTDASYRTTANRVIFSEGRGWRPVGTFASPFDAVFNANDHTIANLRIDRAHRDYVGLFAHVGANAKLEDIGLADAYVRGRSVVGALVGNNADGTIIGSYTSNVATTTLVIGSGIRVGGLVGDHKGIVEHGSYTSGVVRGNRSVGGLVGYFSGLNSGENASDYGIINSYAESAVHGRVFTGGLVGSNNNRIVNSYAIGDVASIFHAGGLVGLNGGSIENTYAISNVAGQEIVGGLVGENEGLIANSYAVGMVSGQSLVGELVGNNSGTIRHSYAVGNLDLVGLDLDGTISTSSVVADLAGLLTSINRTVWDANAWSFEDGKYPALRYIRSAGCESDMIMRSIVRRTISASWFGDRKYLGY